MMKRLAGLLMLFFILGALFLVFKGETINYAPASNVVPTKIAAKVFQPEIIHVFVIVMESSS